MKKQLSISVDTWNGEASLTKGTESWLNDLISKDSLMAADVLMDLTNDINALYEKAISAVTTEYCHKQSKTDA